MYKDPICWDLKSGKASKRVDTKKQIYGVDCGKNTWADFDTQEQVKEHQGWQIGTAGRQQFNMGPIKPFYEDFRGDPPAYQYVRVGKYDSKKMPAATLWRGDCEYSPQRYFYDERITYPGEFDIEDIYHRTMRLSGAVDAVTLRPGYRVTLYSKNGWRGEEETIYGAYQKGREKEERLECQKVKNNSSILSDAV